MKQSRRAFLQHTSLIAATLPLATAPALASEPGKKTAAEKKGGKIECFPLVHAGIKPVRHERLGTTINAQTAVATIRFFRSVRLDRLEIPPTVYGRNRPRVPIHPAHLLVSIFDRASKRWRVVREIDVPANPKFSGEGLSHDSPIGEQETFFAAAIKEHGAYDVPLDGLETDHLRIECDREHPTWANHGECNGNVHHVPYGMFRELIAYGETLEKYAAVAPYRTILTQGPVRPVAPAGMTVETDGRMVFFRGGKLAVGFAVNRPTLLHLGWDETEGGRADLNRLLATRTFQGADARIVPMAGLSGPILRTLEADIGSHLWTGRFEAEGNEIRYLDVHTSEHLRLNLVFRVEAERLQLEIEEVCTQEFVALEYEAWRFAWDARTSPTGVCVVPTLRVGRNGHALLPAYLSGESSGCLSFRQVGTEDSLGVHLQVESYRESEALTCGVGSADRSPDGFGITVPVGTRKTRFELAVATLLPQPSASGATLPLSAGVRRAWATIFSCYRPEYRGFSNNCVSVNCHLGQWSMLEVLAHTAQPKDGPSLVGMLKFTVEKALLDGGGYGYWRELYMDSDPALLCAAGTYYRLQDDPAWLARVAPGLREIFDRMMAQTREDGLLLNERLTGNTGDFNVSTNGIDTVCFGYLDAYSNAWAYRAFRNAAPLFAKLGDGERARRAVDVANRMARSYAPTFVNPKTGWVAGWRSQDGQLHDYAYLVVNGIAIAFGLLDEAAARQALSGLEKLRAKACPVSAQLGLPVNLIPHAFEDHYFPMHVRGSQPTYELFTDGAVSSNLIEYYLRALSTYGFKAEAKALADAFDEGYAKGFFSGGVGSGCEMRSWEGMPSGYEGTLTFNHGLIYAVAIEKGVVEPRSPEWWPAGGGSGGGAGKS